MPKLHFYDTGLACWLLGMRSPEQLRSHPLRGSIFESWVVSEVVKHRANAAERGPVYFYRDKNGVEADLLIESADGFTVLEAKSGQTVTSDMLAAPTRISETLSALGAVQPLVAYGGTVRQDRTGLTVVPWNELHTLDWT
jgi:predicted AAA+ superfamily ATPase